MGDFSCAQRVLFQHRILDKDQRPRQLCRFYNPIQAHHWLINQSSRHPLSEINTFKVQSKVDGDRRSFVRRSFVKVHGQLELRRIKTV